MKLDFKEERDMDFLSSYKLVLKEYGRSAPYLKKEFLLSRAILKPAKRFYVSEEQCSRIIGNMLRGKVIDIKNPLKLMMYDEILSRVKAELHNSTLLLPDIIRNVINQPSPRFYLTLESAQILYYKLIKHKRK